MQKKILFVVNVDWFFVSHRLPIALAAKRAGFEVHVAAAPTGLESQLIDHGFFFHPLDVDRSSTGVLSGLGLLFQIMTLYKQVRPHIVHLVTIKPVVIGGIAARIARIPAVLSAVSGLGFVFIGREGFVSVVIKKLVTLMYRTAFSHKNQMIVFQNSDDQQAVLDFTGTSPSKAVLIKGSGTDLSSVTAVPEPRGVPVVVMASRLLRDKGVYEFVEAARIIRARGVQAKFWLIGDLDAGNPASVGDRDLRQWEAEGVVELFGRRDDVPSMYSLANLVVLPSYREGLPKSLIEAAACGRAVVTTDVPGCRDAIESGVTGLLVPPRDAEALAEAIAMLVSDAVRREQMGRQGRRLAEAVFDVNEVIRIHLSLYSKLIREC